MCRENSHNTTLPAKGVDLPSEVEMDPAWGTLGIGFLW